MLRRFESAIGRGTHSAPISFTRFFSGSYPHHGDKTVIPQIILDQLKDTSEIAPTPRQRIRERKKQIFLKPEEVTDKRFRRLVEDLEVSSRLRRPTASKNLRIIRDNLVPDAPNIEGFKPLISTINKSKYDKIKNDLVSSFTHSQLALYLQTKYAEQEYSRFRRSVKATKAVLAERILAKIWNIERSDVFTAMDDLLVQNSYKLSKSDLFLLLSENGYILQYLSRVGAKISFDPTEDKIIFVGTASQVNNAEINLTSILNNSHREQINLAAIKKLFLEKYNEFSLNTIGRNTEVYFNHLQNDDYELITLNANQIKRSKRLLLWLLNYNQHLKENILVNTTDATFIPFKDDDSLAWNNRNQNLFLLKKPEVSASSNSLFLNDILKYSDLRLSKDILNFEDDIETAKSIPLTAGKSENDLEQESWQLLGDLGILSEDCEEPALGQEKESKALEEKMPNALKEKESPAVQLLSEEQIDDLYSKLIDFSYRNSLNGVPDDKLNQPIITVTLGNILFQGEKSTEGQSIIPQPPSLTNSNINYKFNSNVTLANDKALSLPLYDHPTLSIKEMNHFLNRDPHNYVIQLKFLPSAYVEELDQMDVEKQIKYPPVEIWIDLNDRSTPDIDTMNVVTVEGENNCYISLPANKSDMKVCCQLSGDLLQQQESKENQDDDFPETLNDILNKTTQRYARFDGQPGISKFLSDSKLDFSGKVAMSIAPFIDLIVNGEVVKYHYINASYRRQLNLSYGKERLVQFNIVEGGSLGGRKLEINFVGDMDGNIDKQQFKELMKDASDFITEL